MYEGGGIGTVKKKGGEAPIKVFRLCVLGSPEVGKTSFCTLYNTNRTFSVYNHTRKPKFYCRDFSRRMLGYFKAEEEAEKERAEKQKARKKKSKPKRKKKKNQQATVVERYGVQMIDVPGEVHADVAPKTEEIKILTTTVPFDHTRPAGSEGNESTPLLSRTFSTNQNRLHDRVLPHAFMIIFDFNEENSFQKAKTIAEFIRDPMNNTEIFEKPIFFFGNKVDRTSSKEDNDRNWAHFTKDIRELASGKGSVDAASAIMLVHRGSVNRNQVYEASPAQSMSVEEYMDFCIQRMNVLGCYSTGEDEAKRGKKKARQQEEVEAPNSAASNEAWCNCILQ